VPGAHPAGNASDQCGWSEGLGSRSGWCQAVHLPLWLVESQVKSSQSACQQCGQSTTTSKRECPNDQALTFGRGQFATLLVREVQLLSPMPAPQSITAGGESPPKGM